MAGLITTLHFFSKTLCQFHFASPLGEICAVSVCGCLTIVVDVIDQTTSVGNVGITTCERYGDCWNSLCIMNFCYLMRMLRGRTILEVRLDHGLMGVSSLTLAAVSSLYYNILRIDHVGLLGDISFLLIIPLRLCFLLFPSLPCEAF